MNRKTIITAKRLAALVIAAFAVISFAACIQDGPPNTDKPAVKELNGTYVSEYGTFIFNGDGKTIKATIGEELAAICGIEQGTYEGSYAFLMDNRGLRRYDEANLFQLSLNGVNARLRNDFTRTCFERIVIEPTGESTPSMVFEREDTK